MSIEIALAPRNQAGLNKQLKAAYNTHSKTYQHWLAKGQFEARYAPTRAERTAVTSYLRSAGLAVQTSSSPFLVRASGSSRRVSAAFRTTLSTYRNKKGTKYFSNSSAVRLPSSLTHSVLGVIGLSNTVREHSMIMRAKNVAHPARTAKAAKGTASCEAPYPTTAQLFDAVNNGVGFPFGFGAEPGCNNLTPSQDNSIYGAPHVGRRGQGAGVNLAVFELSAYQHSDISTWAQTFYGPGYNAPLVDVNVDGGPPNDFTGQTELDEYTAIARADQAAVVSSSWAVCENDVSSAYVQAENEVFEQMALQGQSVFGAEGDTGAFSCIRSDGSTSPPSSTRRPSRG